MATTTTDLWQFRESMSFVTRGADLTGFEVAGKDGEVGRVHRASNDVRVDYLVVEARDWLGRRRVLLPAYSVVRVDPAGRTVTVDLTRDAIREAPDFDPDDRSVRFQDALHGWYDGLYDTGL